ncbi:MAG: hypothetical protein HN542_04160 [Flavobacteriales bacterium]|jgi:hypothetical protein|nr:hypothetical protein [Flavobacteriales bacterium]NCG28994.1 hypothetical protein [Bacteroidota bacterium]MBT4931459.1 hypothetical protein [Flavobacteriales bacterium]MBT5131571.1 hypothetical protein [Flavobacteriales bacterium]MBT5977718.1 hypothetical protein [Flavobacteriales bacterium]
MKTESLAGRVHLEDLHFEHKRWISELEFFKTELQFFRARLEEIATRYTSNEVMKELEHFQNIFYIEGNAIDVLIHDVNQHEHGLAQYAEEHPIAIDHVLFEDHKPLRDRIERNRLMMNEMKRDYQRYLAKWMYKL